MAFPIRKNTSMSVNPMSALDIFVARKLKESGLRTAQNELTPEQKQQIEQIVQNMKTQIFDFVSQLEKLISQAGNQSAVDIDPIADAFDGVFDGIKEVEEYRDFLPEIGIDPENLDLVLDFMEPIAVDGVIANHNSRRADPNLANDEMLINALSSLMEVSVQIEDEDYSLEDHPDISTQEVPQNVIEILLSDDNAKKEELLRHYGITLEMFNKFLADNGYSNTRNLAKAHPEQVKDAYTKFISSAIIQGSENRVRLDGETYDLDLMGKIIGKPEVESDKRDRAKVGVLNGSQLYHDYYSGNNQGKNISPLFMNFISSIAYSSQMEGSSVRSLREPYSQSEIDRAGNEGTTLFSSSLPEAANPEEVQKIQAKLEKFRNKLEIAPDDFKQNIQASIDKLENQLAALQPSATDQGFTSGLTFGKVGPKDKRAIESLSNRGEKALQAFKSNPNDLGALGVAVENYGKIYNMSSGKNEMQAKKINDAVSALDQSAWYKFLSPAYRFIQEANNYFQMIGAGGAGIEKQDIDSSAFRNRINDLQELYLFIVSGKGDPVALMKDFEFASSEFLYEANLALTSQGARTRGPKIVGQMFKYNNLIRINVNNPEAVVVINENTKNKEQGKLTANVNMSGFTIVPTYRIG